jgi:hypothetical protein
MIPGVMVDFLHRASVAIGSTRTRDLVPNVHFLSGWYVEENREILVCLVSAGFTDRLIESLEDNGHFAVTAEVIGPHETYQFKGIGAGSRPAAEADAQVHRACQQRFLQALGRHFPNRFREADVRAWIGPPAIAVRVRVDEIFVQTPGPAAGRRLFPQRAR